MTKYLICKCGGNVYNDDYRGSYICEDCKRHYTDEDLTWLTIEEN